MVALNISILFNKHNMSKHQTIFSNIPNKKTKKKKIQLTIQRTTKYNNNIFLFPIRFPK